MPAFVEAPGCLCALPTSHAPGAELPRGEASLEEAGRVLSSFACQGLRGELTSLPAEEQRGSTSQFVPLGSTNIAGCQARTSTRGTSPKPDGPPRWRVSRPGGSWLKEQLCFCLPPEPALSRRLGPGRPGFGGGRALVMRTHGGAPGLGVVSRAVLPRRLP